MKFISFTDKNDTLCFFNINHIITCHLSSTDIYILMSPSSDEEILYQFTKEKEPNLFYALRDFFTSKLEGDHRIVHSKDSK